MDSKEVRKYFFLLLFVGLIYLAYLVVQPLLAAALTGCIAAYIFYPIYLRFRRKLRPVPASLLLTIAIVIIVLLPLAATAIVIATQGASLYENMKLSFAEDCGAVCRLTNISKNLFAGSQQYFEVFGSQVAEIVFGKIKDLLVQLPIFVLKAFIVVFVMFYMFVDGQAFVKKLEDLMPLSKGTRQELVRRFSDMTSAILRGQLIIAAIQGTLGAIGFYVVGIKFALFWGALMAVMAFVPMVGTSVIWVPASLVLIGTGLFSHNYMLIGKGVGLFAYCLLVVSTVDNMLGPRIIGKKAELHPVLVLLGVLGGIPLFGFVGFIIGPLILGLLITAAEIYKRDQNETSS